MDFSTRINVAVCRRSLSEFDTMPPAVLECMGFLDSHGLYVPGSCTLEWADVHHLVTLALTADDQHKAVLDALQQYAQLQLHAAVCSLTVHHHSSGV